MAKQFKGFSNQQTHQLLSEMGYTGPAQKDDMDLFLASSPAAASKIGRYADIAKQRVEGGPLSGMGMQAGGNVANTLEAARQQAEALRPRSQEQALATGTTAFNPLQPGNLYQETTHLYLG